MGFLRSKRRAYADPIDPFSEEFLKRKPQRARAAQQPTLQRGDLASSSIFESPDAGAKPLSRSSSTPDTPAKPATASLRRDPAAMAAALDPNPRARKRWQRKMTIRAIRSRGRLNKTTKILRTERSHLAKSHFLKTSIKKLGPLARQIAGKSLEDAIIQMRFSPKKAAREVKRHLEYAKDEAVARRGMGLGGVDGKGAVEGGEMVVEDKSGKRRIVRNKTEIYVDQAWVGRGPYGHEVEYRARGQANIMSLPYTSKSFSSFDLVLMDYVRILMRSYRHFDSFEGRGDEDTVAGGKGAEEAEEEGLGALAG